MKSLAVVVLLLGSAFAQKDGPATLPTRKLDTSLAATPAPNPPKLIGATANLQLALNAAICGDKFELDPAFVGSITTLPSLACDDAHWIWIMSAGTLPPEGTRIKPGTLMLPKLIVNSSAGTIKGGVKIRLIGLEITRPTGTGLVYDLLAPGNGANNIVIDRTWVHGTSVDETVRGIDVSNTNGIGVVDSYFSDFHCAAPGSCSDSQGISGGLDTVPNTGNYVVMRNYIEASAENFILGGGPALFTPTDVTISDNEFHKPDSWNPLDPSYTPVNGRPWSVKNHFELKNADRVLFERNTLSGTWGGFSQTGFSILLTPKNQNGQCPICVVTNVTIRYNRITKVGQALQLALAPSGSGDWAAAGNNWSIHHNSFDSGYKTCYQCGKWAVQISSDHTPAGVVLHDVVVNKNSFIVNYYPSGGGFLSLGGPATAPQIYNVQYTNNTEYAGQYPIYSIGGGAANCATAHLFKPDIIAACWTGQSAFTGNVIMYTGTVPRGMPPGNTVVDAGADVTLLP